MTPTRPTPPPKTPLPKVAGAPISWGVCEVPGWGHVLDPGTVLAEMAALGLTATELGPPDYLPSDPERLRAVLSGYGLGLVGGFLPVVLHDAAPRDETLAEADRVAGVLAAGGAEVLVLAASTGLDGYDERPALTDEQWRTLVSTAAAVRDVAARHGLTTALHPHVGTHVETGEETERFLADSDLPICLDTGHLLIGGGDPVAIARRWAGRIGHVHLKDVRASVAARVRAGELTYTEAVGQGIYTPLGDGDVDVASIVASLTEAGYRGWYVLEQDTALSGDGAEEAAQPRRDTARSLARLHELLGVRGIREGR
ncbi:inosose dehydratase [Streptoalloteichus tenebrarius]|uniref:Inosose dehydratase n=1 Tax=Streptoalloteichus tenebrarius (strain ATCC 17920 / DSM 40477 / JCM 4838 / CBS 697.72 / NBRC 16177 / NCIMB 11028 / NRRL B-12390 / A12253. 1 / ISP 5477) TaxID=1933 RepID=A0ABT1HV17_STRSD|nr:TIM barrel protein [Streptoalloteichus tenebrarius]MCP2259359.1 inosose dehydratase [Streptoalloteichus tenebrarius]BFF02299.1 TIM barrel protein [Streptoalloteichus tenebrarius]